MRKDMDASVPDQALVAVEATARLQRELDIMNADHIVLWLEANTIPDEPMNQCASWLACRIVEAHEAAMRAVTPVQDDDANYLLGMAAAVRERPGTLIGNSYTADRLERIAARLATDTALVEALTDALAGWRYIRKHHGDLYGVAWDRVENALTKALASRGGDNAQRR